MTQGNEEPLAPSVLERLDSISTALSQVAGKLEKVAQAGRRTRLLAIGLAGSFLLDIALTVVVTLLSVSALTQGSSIHTSQLAACSIGNQTRAAEVSLWGYVIALSSTDPHADKAELARFQAFVSKTFAPVNCVRVYG